MSISNYKSKIALLSFPSYSGLEGSYRDRNKASSLHKQYSIFISLTDYHNYIILELIPNSYCRKNTVFLSIFYIWLSIILSQKVICDFGKCVWLNILIWDYRVFFRNYFSIFLSHPE